MRQCPFLEINRASEAYHLGELRTARNPGDPAHILPPPVPLESRILDVGCGAGQTLLTAYPDRTTFGVDIDLAALRLGKTLTQDVQFACGKAETLPYRNNAFDFFTARVSLAYTNIPASLQEIQRVLKPGGMVWMTLHPMAVPWDLAKSANWKGKIFFGYIVANSLWLHWFRRQFSFLGRNESFQTERGMRRLLTQCGFQQVTAARRQHFVMTAQTRKPG